jgi:hypothetical protein
MADTSAQGRTAPSGSTGASTADPGTGRRYRARGESAREHRLTPRFTGAELAQIRAAAEAAQMTLTGFCALAALAMARRRQPDEPAGEAAAGVQELAEMQRELFAARTAVNRTGVNLNQAVAQLNATGTPPVWLDRAVARVTRAVAEVDAVASLIHRRLTRSSAGTSAEDPHE